MADFIYLLQNRLSPAQQAALQTIRDVAKAHSITAFLVGGAVRDLISGSPVRDLDVAVQGNALKLKKDMEFAGAVSTGEVASWQAFFAQFQGGVRVEIGSTLSVAYPKPGKPVVQPATILDDLRRRDFTANAMALSLNEGSYGLLMDPMNGVADIENRQLRLVSNYGFIEDPVRMIRAARFAARLGWTMDEKTQTRYETGKDEKYIAALNALHRGYETEEIFHEEDPLRVLRKLEEEGWMKHLFPAMTVAKANATELERLRGVQTQLQVSGIHPDSAAANFPLLTAKLSVNELSELKKSFVRQGFVKEVEALENAAKEFAAQLTAKNAALPSQAWKLFHGASPEAVLWAAFSSKSPAVQAKLKSFHSEWPKARQKVPFALMQEMRIVPAVDSFNEVVDKIFFELMDGNLTTPEEQKTFLEPFSPPAPPPPVRLARSRAGKKDGKAAKGKKKAAALLDEDEDLDTDRDLDDDEDLQEEAPPAKDLGEGMDELDPVLQIDEETEDIVPSSKPQPEAVDLPGAEEIVAPAPAPAASTGKPKRRASTADETTAGISAESVPSMKAAVKEKVLVADGKPEVQTVPPTSATTDKKPASPQAEASKTRPAEKTAGTSAIKTPVQAAPVKAATVALKAPSTGKSVVAEQATTTAKKAAAAHSVSAVKSPTDKNAPTPSKPTGKKA